MSHAQRDRYSNLVDEKLRVTLVQRDGIVWNNRYEGNPTAGAVKIPVRDTEVTVGDYDKATGAEATTGTTTYLNVPINKDKYVNEVVDGYDAAAVPDDLVADRLDSAGYSMGLTINNDGTTELVASGTDYGATTAMTDQNIYDTLVDTRTKLSTANVPKDGRWLLVKPAIYALLLKDKEHFIRASDMGDAVVRTGAVGEILGMLVFEDNTLPSNVDFIAGHPGWCTRVHEWSVPVHKQDLSGSGKWIGACAVQGRKVYAHKVTKAAAVIVKKNA